MKKLVPLAAIAALAVTVAACNVASPAAPTISSGTVGVGIPRYVAVYAGTLSSDDRALVQIIAQIHDTNRQLGDYADALADRQEVKLYAFQMVEEGTDGQAALREIAGDQYPSNLVLTTQQTTWRTQVMAQRGSALDPVFVDTMVAAHTAHLATLQAQRSGIANAVLRTHVDEVIAHLTANLAFARDLQTYF
jgi:predicted outer membrane protein